MIWSDAFDGAGEGPGVFVVAPAQRAAVLTWVGHQRVATVSRRELHAPAVDAWAVLDGGVVQLHPHHTTRLAAGLRVVGFRALRLIAAELALATPGDGLPGEGPAILDVDELRRRHRSTPPHRPAVLEQAELLAACIDAPTLRWVSTTLAAELRPAPD
jgi:hypothetical protein